MAVGVGSPDVVPDLLQRETMLRLGSGTRQPRRMDFLMLEKAR